MDIYGLLHNILIRALDRLPHRFKRYFIEIILISVASSIAGVSLFMFQLQSNSIHSQEVFTQGETHQSEPRPNSSQPTPLLAVDISGAVNNPDVYYASPGARIIDMIKMAGGLSYQADASFVSRNFNLSTYVFDQEKIYIPSLWDISQGIYIEESKLLEYLEPRSFKTNQDNTQPSSNSTYSSTSASNLSINTASKEELDMLPGVGPVTAQKIIENRPYESIEELLSKKVVNTSLWEKIQEHISP